MVEDNFIANLGENVPLPREYLITHLVEGVIISVEINRGNTNYTWQQSGDSTPLPTLLDTQGQLAYSTQPLDPSHIGQTLHIPLKLVDETELIETEQNIVDKVNQYFNEAVLIYVDNGTPEQLTFYGPDESGTTQLNNIANYEPGTHSVLLANLTDFVNNYNTLRADPTLPTRMSHYNQDWENIDQIIYDASNNNDLTFDQVIWNVYNFGTTGKTTVNTKEGEIELPDAVAPAFKKQYEVLENKLGDKAPEAFSKFYENSRAKQLLETKFKDDLTILEE